jgi:hypothetical protein
MSRWVIEKMEDQYRDEETGKVPWGVTNLDDPDFGMETFNTKAEATAFIKEQKNMENK